MGGVWRGVGPLKIPGVRGIAGSSHKAMQPVSIPFDVGRAWAATLRDACSVAGTVVRDAQGRRLRWGQNVFGYVQLDEKTVPAEHRGWSGPHWFHR